LLLLFSPSWGKPVTPEDAVQAVAGWLVIDGRPLEENLGAVSARVRMYGDASEVFSRDQALYYAVFLEPKGIVFVPADDQVEPIPAWQPDAGDYDPSENGPFQALVIADLKGRVKSARNAEAKLHGKLHGLSAEPSEEQEKWNRLRAAKAPKSEAKGEVRSQASSVSDLRVGPLLQSAWDQTAKSPLYNYYTPGNYVAGCVATAMGQVMRYFKYPQAGIGTKSFSFTVDDKPRSGTTRGGDGRGGPYRWDAMPFQPGNSATTAERQNIGALLFDIGISVKSSYTLDETGATMALAFKRLTDTFRYSNAVYGATASRTRLLPIPSEVLNRMVNSNLDAGLPVLLGITGAEGGHAIAADGYGYSASTLYHHLNMGWGGPDNAWYALPRIETSPQFSTVNGCVYNVYPTGKGEIISGRVLDSSGAPISGATVSLTGSAVASATTDAKGIFAFAKLPSNGTYTLTAKKAGYTFGRQTTRTGQSVSPQVSLDGGVAIPGSNACGNMWNVTLRAASGGSNPTPQPTPTPPPSPGVVPVLGITVSPKTMTLGIGEYYRPTVTISPSNAADKTVTWTTHNKYVVDLVKDSSGQLFLKGVSAGTAQITFKALGGTNLSASMTVTVKSNSASTPAVPARAITVSPKTMTLGVGEYYRPAVTFSPSNVTDKTVTWTTDNKYVVDLVKASGMIYLKGVARGTARITLKAQGGTNVSTSMTVTVKTGYSLADEYSLDNSDNSLDEKDDDAIRSLDDDIPAAAPSESHYSLSEFSDEGTEDKQGCDVGLGLLALVPAGVFAARRRRTAIFL
jgi:uncharacterized protein YjdB